MCSFLIASALLLVCVPVSGVAMAEEEQEGSAPTEGKYKINLEPFAFSLMKRGRVVGKVDMQLVIELEDGSDYPDISSQVPRIRSDIAIALTDFANQQIDVDRPIDPDLLSAYLTPFLDYRLGKGRVKIYVQQAIVEPK